MSSYLTAPAGTSSALIYNPPQHLPPKKQKASKTTTHPSALKVRHKLPRTIVLPRAVQRRDLGEHVLEVRLGLLRALAEGLDRPVLALLEEPEELVEQLVPRDARHALVLAFGRFLLAFLWAGTRVGEHRTP